VKNLSPAGPDSFARVLEVELEEIAERRARAGVPIGALASGPRSAGELDLVGLSVSGGGIRSASFSLGVLQAFERAGSFREFDYISTVSGGGYIGAAMSAMLNEPESAAFPFAKSRSHDSTALAYFRSRINYLNPGALLDTIRLPALILRGILLNVLALTPWLLLAVSLTDLAYVLLYNAELFDYLSWIPLVLGLPFLALLTTFPLAARFGRRGRAFRERYDRAFAATLVLAALGFVAHALGFLVIWAVEQPSESLRDVWARFRVPFLLVLGALPLGYVTLRALAPRAAAKLRRLSLYGTGALVPLLLFGAYVLLCIHRIEPPYLDTRLMADLDRASKGSALSEAASKALEKRGIVLAKGERVSRCRNDDRYNIETYKGECWVVPGEGQIDHLLGLWRGKLALDELHFRVVLNHKKTEDQLFIGLSLLVFLLYFFALDANSLSLHGFYRDCLSRMLLFRVRADGSVEPLDDLKLSSLKPGKTGAPYPLLNATLNVQGATDSALRYRKGVSFVFSPRFLGSTVTGYAPSAAMESADPELSLASAMAISAAAAGPNMGSFTQGPLRLLLTLCNLRLGYWLPNPRRVAAGEAPRKRPGPRHVLLEAFGLINANRRYVNVSDGGHFENLGVYELLRRQCRLIVAIDGEEDMQGQFNGLVTLMRIARIDLGVSITADLTALRKMGGPFSERHWLWATIHYSSPDGSEALGHLLYIKASLSGDESEHIRAYHARSPAFPHEPTVDQFFDENQFESYRALGEHIGERSIEDSHLLEKLREIRRSAAAAHELTA
jgi:hypothetical protein